MSDEDVSIVDRVQVALAKSGYPLEMRVARIAQTKKTSYVHQSRYYVDSATEKVRETDVLACWMSLFETQSGEQVWTALYLVVECKSKPSPWVVFDEGADATHEAALRLDLAVTRRGRDGSDFLHRMVREQDMGPTLSVPAASVRASRRPSAMARAQTMPGQPYEAQSVQPMALCTMCPLTIKELRRTSLSSL